MGVSSLFWRFRALLKVIFAGQRWWRQAGKPAAGMMARHRIHRFPGGFRDRGVKMTPMTTGGPAVAVRVSVTVTQVNEDGSQSPVDGELAAALAGPAEQFSS